MSTDHQHSVLGCIKRMTELARSGQMWSWEFFDHLSWLARQAFEPQPMAMQAEEQQEAIEASRELKLAVECAANDDVPESLLLFRRPGQSADTTDPQPALGGGLLVGLIAQLLSTFMQNPELRSKLIDLLIRWVSGSGLPLEGESTPPMSMDE